LVHGSTISGHSLPLAFVGLEMYFSGERNFNVDIYEQLARSCLSAKTLYERRNKSLS